MSKRAYVDWNPTKKSIDLVDTANSICREMKADGYDLTLRQLYYQLVARGYVDNNQRVYSQIGELVNKARLAGMMDWDYITDRTRNMQTFAGHETPQDVIETAKYTLRPDRWAETGSRIEVWVEKEALVGVVQRAAYERRVPFFACRGYVSQSEMHAAARRHIAYQRGGQDVTVLHLGDHDPSGVDMSRDIQERLTLFGARTTVDRIALNRDQIDQYNPPPNPAKLTDSRATEYIRRHGTESWELDALRPQVIHDLIVNAVDDIMDTYQDDVPFDAAAAREALGRNLLGAVADNWEDVVERYGEAG